MSSKILVFVILLRWGVGSNTARSCPHGTDLLDRSAPAFLLDRRPPVSREYAAHDTLRARAHRAWRGHKGVGKVKPGQHRPQGGVLHPDLDRIGPRDLVAKSQHLGDAIAKEKPYEAETDKAILNSTPAWERQARLPQAEIVSTCHRLTSPLPERVTQMNPCQFVCTAVSSRPSPAPCSADTAISRWRPHRLAASALWPNVLPTAHTFLLSLLQTSRTH